MSRGVYFLTSHPNSSNHFVEFIEAMQQEGIECGVIPTDNVKSKFTNVRILDPSEIKGPAIVVADYAFQNLEALFTKWHHTNPDIELALYYDNPEKFVPGGYSEDFAKVAKVADTILFANANLVSSGIEKAPNEKIDLEGKKKMGIGYYPTKEAKEIIKKRAESQQIRKDLFEQLRIEDKGQQIYAYMGGANEEYFEKAFPAFLDILSKSELENAIVVLQQHPRAGNRDTKLLEQFSFNIPICVSKMQNCQTLAIADVVLYYQTSMAPQFVFGDIPKIIQIGHNTYTDVLVRHGITSVTSSEQLQEALLQQKTINKTLLKIALGMNKRWKKQLRYLFAENRLSSILRA
jgi:hypothetical protein